MDDQKRLTDSAIDRFAMASCAMVMVRRMKALRAARRAADPAPLPLPMGWVRSHAITSVIAELARRGRASQRVTQRDRERMRRKLGLSPPTASAGLPSPFLHYDVVLLCLYGDEHWSLMVCYVQTEGAGVVFHYDSLFGAHRRLAQRTTRALILLGVLPIGCKLRRVDAYPQQRSYYECGYSVLLMVGAVMTAAMRQIGDPVRPLIPTEFPSLDREGVRRLRQGIFQKLGNSTVGTYPSEAPEDAAHSTSYVPMYRRVRDQMIAMHATPTPTRTTEAARRIAKRARVVPARGLCASAPL